jgi:DeoR family transcriptional regulator, aga operon transcriptional repressor
MATSSLFGDADPRRAKTGSDEGDRSLLTAERRMRIAELVLRQGVVYIEELARLFRVSHVTIRNDLDLLAREGVLVRDRGGAVANTRATLTTAFNQRAELNLDPKRRIGYAAAQLVSRGDTIILDAGTTTMEMAKCLVNESPLTVVTTALNVAMQVGCLPDVHVLLIGGSLSRTTISTIGPHATQHLNDLLVQKAFIGTHALDEGGLIDLSIEVAQVKRAMIQAAREVILLADSSKWGRAGFAKVLTLSSIHTIITDDNLPPEARTAIARQGIRLIVA